MNLSLGLCHGLTIRPLGPMSENFFVNNLQIFLISQSVCPRQDYKPRLTNISLLRNFVKYGQKSFPIRSQNLRARPEPTQFECLSDGTFLGKLLVLPTNVRLDWKVIPRYKHSSLFGLIISNEEKTFYNIDTRSTAKTFITTSLSFTSPSPSFLVNTSTSSVCRI